MRSEPAYRSAFDYRREHGGGWSPLFSEPLLKLAVAKPGERGFFGVLRSWDRALLRLWPGAAWSVVVRGVR